MIRSQRTAQTWMTKSHGPNIMNTLTSNPRLQELLQSTRPLEGQIVVSVNSRHPTMTDSICVATEAIKSTSISEYSATRTSTGTADVVFDLVPSSKIRYSIHVEFRQPIVATIARPSEPRSGIEDRRCEASSSKDG